MNHTERRERRRRMAEEVRNGAMCIEVAEAYGVSTKTVQKACAEQGTKVHRWIQGPSRKTFRILKALIDGEIQADVSRKFGVSRQRVQQIAVSAREAGFEV